MQSTMTRRVAAGGAALALLAGGGVLAGCGSGYDAASGGGATAEPNGIEKLPAKEILTKSAAAMATASSVTVFGLTKEDDNGPEMSLDLTLGTGVGQGTMTVGGDPFMEFREVDGKMYWKISRKGVEAILGPGEASKAIGDRWVVAPVGTGDDDVPGPGDLGDKDTLLASLTQEGITASVTGTGEVKGTPVVFVKTSGKEGTATLAIQTVGEPYAVQARGEATGNIDFSDWNAPVNVTAPTGAVSPDELIPEDAASG